MARFSNLGSICVKGRLKISKEDMKHDLHIAFVDNHNLDAVQADTLIERHSATITKKFNEMTNVIEYTVDSYQKAINKITKDLYNKS